MLGFIQILGGLALFLFGISLLSSGMEKLAGDQIQKWLDRVTNNRMKSMAFGTASTAVLQSSGLLMVTMIGLINANLMTVTQSISVMLGQEIGTTVTAQIVAFDIGNLRLLLVILGYIFLEFFPKRDWRKFGEILMGLGIIFVGMTYMSGALDELIQIPWIANLLEAMGQYPLIGVLLGIVATAITQSSTAVTSMAVAMGMTQVITLEGAIGIILGANIGSCVTGLLASLRLSSSARQASYAQILINVIGVLIFLPFIPQFAEFIERTSSDLPRQIANAHTIFNLSVSLALFPFVKQIAAVVKRIAPDDPVKTKEKLTKYIDEMQYAVPSVALNEAARELARLGEVTEEMVELSCHALLKKVPADAEKVLALEDQVVNPVTKEIEHFVNNLFRTELSNSQYERALQIKTLLVDVERVGDMAENIANGALDRIAGNITFTAEVAQELVQLSNFARSIYSQSLQAFRTDDAALALEVRVAENEFDNMYWQAREMHLQRLKEGSGDPEAEAIFRETLRLLERISDHADNLGASVLRSGNHAPAEVVPT
jgi:phosphate:Na+ symporter